MVFTAFALSFSLTSCSDDATLESSALSIDNNDNIQDRGGQQGNNGNRGDRNNDVSRLNNGVLSSWTDLFLEIERYAAGMRPNASARAIAYIYLAAYETAIPGMRDYQSLTNQLDGLSIDRELKPRNVDYEIALNMAFSTVLDHFLINIPSDLGEKIVDLKDTQLLALSRNKSQRLINDSEQWGSYVANSVIAYSLSDNAAERQILSPQPDSYEPPTGDGYWTYSADPERALYPYWESVRTFVIAPEETTSVPPIPYSEVPGSPYHDEMMEVYTVNNAAKTTDHEQLWIAEFWSDDVEGLMFSPPARQVSIANQLIDQYDTDLDVSLEVFVKVGLSLNDAAVSAWKYKYQYMVMRPSNYIHEFIDPSFQTNLYRLIYWPNPSFPGYPSGHSCFASAAAGIFIDIFGNRTRFTDKSHEGRTEFLGEPRSFNSFEALAEENAFSRIPLGVHIRMDCAEGLRLGYEISDAVNKIPLKRRAS